MAKSFKVLVGTFFFQFWILFMGLAGYMIYRLIVYRETWNIILFIVTMILQFKYVKSELFIKFQLWFQMMEWFDKREIVEVEKPKKSNSMFCFHPHGIYSMGMVHNLYTKNTFFENLVVLSSRFALSIPFSGLLLTLFGLQGVHPENLTKLLKKGSNVGIMVGGFEEATLTKYGENRVYIKERKGFIKYALRYGTTIYPVFTFGENNMFYTYNGFQSLRLWLNKFKLIGTIYWSRFLTVPEPHIEMITVCGKGIELPKIENPSKEDIDKYHQSYIQGLKELYDTYAPKYAPKVPLQIF
ncbi:unnamed protein product [Paramecium octaurelia]|uniref:diacylglycerol O-acyltransferase n=1 Tax=Paramecium octaurelia TaxID=43137 RepID=A0A8S1XEA9_PAROT|nr:unnamed protein product [Paramecium octaurelia]